MLVVLADCTAGRVARGCAAACGFNWPFERRTGLNRRRTCRASVRLVFDTLDQLEVASDQCGAGKSRPWRNRCERHGDTLGARLAAHIAAAVTSASRELSVDADAFEWLAEQAGHRGRAWPLARRPHEAFLHPLRHDVAQPSDDGVPVEDRDRTRSSRPEGAAPPVEPSNLSSHIAVDVADKPRELLTVVARCKQVVVVGHVREGVEPDMREQLESATQDAQDQVAGFGSGHQQESLLHGAAGDLVDDVRQVPAKRMAHRPLLSNLCARAILVTGRWACP